tara:strand:- start:8910 stop:9569 length:660 start_codon:yes stop_codon:yes gene_type:complete
MTDGLPPRKGAFSLPQVPFEGEGLKALTLNDMAALALALPAEGVENPASPLRKPVLASLSALGGPAVRTVILRSLDHAARRLGFFTDARSAKAAEIARDPRVCVLFYDPRMDIQVRLSGNAEVHVASPSAWQSAPPSSRRAYLVTAPPGTVLGAPASGLPAGLDGTLPSLEMLEEGRANFALIDVTFHEADIVVLSRTGHRRARIRWQTEGVRMAWLVP